MTAMLGHLSGAKPGRHGWRVAIAALVGFGGVPLFSHPAPAAEPAAVIKLVDELKFTPAKVTVKVGDTVRWQNVSVLVHTVTDDPDLVAKEADYALPAGARPFNSDSLVPQGTFEYRFTLPGTYRYFCIPHEAAGMIGEVVVTK